MKVVTFDIDIIGLGIDIKTARGITGAPKNVSRHVLAPI